MGRLGMDEDIPIENRMVTKAIENSQKRVEAHNFDIRKHLLEYDDVMNKQRTEIYSFRKELLQSNNLKDRIYSMMDEVVDEILGIYCPEEKHREEWDMKGVSDAVYGVFSVVPKVTPTDITSLKETLISEIRDAYEKKESEVNSEMMRYLEKIILLQIVDSQWKDHLLAMDHLKEGIGLRGYGQRDPLVEYKKEAFEIFSDMTGRISTEVLRRLFRIQVQKQEAIRREQQKLAQISYNRGEGSSVAQTVRRGKKVGRNEPCPCGSGKKYKKCCGINA
jgi:preprotein translocase subunit SecA